MDKQFATYTKKILNALPYWFAMKKTPDISVGAEFLNIIGLELDQVQYILDYAYQQTKLQTADIYNMDYVYKTILPTYIKEGDTIRIYTSDNSIELKVYSSPSDFYIASSHNNLHPELYYDDTAYIDYYKQTLYVKQKYNDNVRLDYNGITHNLIFDIHHVWNFFDEFGMLFSCTRMYGERNLEYKERLMDTFKNKANSSTTGLINGIARDLGLRKTITILDGSKPTLLKDPMIVLNQILIDGSFANLDDIYITEDNYIWIVGDEYYTGMQREVSYIHGIEMHQLNNKQDYKLQNRLYHIDNTATSLLKYYAERIKAEVPIMWGQWKWDEGYWDVANEDMSGYGYIPNIIDSSIKGFRNYNKL